MTDRELMQQALEALELHAKQYPHMQKGYTVDAITALRERLAQPEMQPCAGRNCGSTNPDLHSAECFEDYEKATGMAQRQTLTDDFWDWLPKAYGDVGDEPAFTKYNMEVAYAAGAEAEAKRMWQGLTDEEVDRVCAPLGAAMLSFTEVARTIEAKLREKNT